MNNRFLLFSIILFFIVACEGETEPKKTIKKGIKIYYLFDISKSFKDDALPTSVEVANKIYSGFIDKNTILGNTFPQYLMTSTIDANSIKTNTPCNVTVDAPLPGAVFKKTPAKIPTMKPCFDGILNKPASMKTDIKGAIFHASEMMSSGNNLIGKGLIIFSDMENDPLASFQNQIPLDNVKGLSIVILYTNTSANVNKLAQKFANDFEIILKKEGAKDVISFPIGAINVQGPDSIFDYFIKSFTK